MSHTAWEELPVVAFDPVSHMVVRALPGHDEEFFKDPAAYFADCFKRRINPIWDKPKVAEFQLAQVTHEDVECMIHDALPFGDARDGIHVRGYCTAIADFANKLFTEERAGAYHESELRFDIPADWWRPFANISSREDTKFLIDLCADGNVADVDRFVRGVLAGTPES